jgi:hypothetical protein
MRALRFTIQTEADEDHLAQVYLSVHLTMDPLNSQYQPFLELFRMLQFFSTVVMYSP